MRGLRAPCSTAIPKLEVESEARRAGRELWTTASSLIPTAVIRCRHARP